VGPLVPHTSYHGDRTIVNRFHRENLIAPETLLPCDNETQEVRDMASKWGKIYEDPEDLRRKLESYFTERDSHRTVQTLRNGDTVEVPDPQPYTIAGMQLATGLRGTTWLDYRSGRYPDMAAVIEWAYTKLVEQWSHLTARPNNNGGAIFYLINVTKSLPESMQSTMAVNVGGQAGNPLQVHTRDDKARLSSCTEEELERIERILAEAESREK